MFKKISYKIALQFTGFVFVLLLINGFFFLAADRFDARRQMHTRLLRTSQMAMERPTMNMREFPRALPPRLRERMRVVSLTGQTLFSDEIFSGTPFSREREIDEIHFQDEEYAVLTTPIFRGGELRGYLQVADIERLQARELPRRAFLYLLVSMAISGLTFLVGLFFARRNLKPAEQMMERLEQFTQDASHELRTPLAVLSSSLDLALKTGKYQEGIVSAKEDLQQISSLVERLLELTRLDTFLADAEEVDFSKLVHEVMERHAILAREKGITLSSNIAPHIVVRGDAALLHQVLSNLLVNAIKFNRQDGTIVVRLTKKILSIQDTGIGIASEDLPHIFDRFYQVDASRSQGGFGLGLALVKRIVEVHGWTIDARSTEGTGTTFTIHVSSNGHRFSHPRLP